MLATLATLAKYQQAEKSCCLEVVHDLLPEIGEGVAIRGAGDCAHGIHQFRQWIVRCPNATQAVTHRRERARQIDAVPPGRKFDRVVLGIRFDCRRNGDRAGPEHGARYQYSHDCSQSPITASTFGIHRKDRDRIAAAGAQ
ncbi:hypothetical protein MTER_30100 [Mycolicibacter terrae]|uniref:Uncharacterized protein n=1 Tax=Mycolicibacter terrae TaxID=1788 RepID=A0AAD1HZB5_9MYCO|nr:hypothetical protein AWC28_04795 [Mycolicibacter terrae]BBX23599.1 hypothetical protein MTER_30100 [Mycolicibacter terrae]